MRHGCAGAQTGRPGQRTLGVFQPFPMARMKTDAPLQDDANADRERAQRCAWGEARSTHSARITVPLPYGLASGKLKNIPVGPCLVENLGGTLIDIVWGAHGERSAAVPVEWVEAAKQRGSLVLLD